MKVLFLNYEYPPLGGGAGNATSYILGEYSKILELEVDLVTSSIDKEYHLESLGKNIRIHRLPIGKIPVNLHYQSQKELLIYAFKAYFFGRKLIRRQGENKYDLTHSFFTVPCGFISLLLKWEFGIPYIVSLRGADVPGYSERFTFLYSILKPLIRMIWKKSAVVAANSQGLRELALKTNSAQKIEVICNGVDINQFSYRYNLNPPEFCILCVSRITPRKGIRYLIEAAKILADEKINFVVKIIGEGDEKEELEKLAQELKIEKFVIFSGMILHQDLPNCYKDADIFVLPSLNEGMSNTMLEALASGLPIIATDTGGTKELVEDEKNGFIVEMRNPSAIAEKIKILKNNNELRFSMSEASRQKAESLSWKKVAQSYCDLYQDVK